LGLRVFFARHRGVDLAAALLLAEAVAALTSPHYPWYFTWLVPFLCLVPSLAAFYLTCASTLIYSVGWPPSFVGGTILFVPFLVLLGIDIAKWLAAPDAVVNAPALPASS
jgi:alpha-1,6-mannosyltransferase